MVNFIKMGAVLAALIFAYWLGLLNGKESEELKHARAQISALTTTIAQYKIKQMEDETVLSDMRKRESVSRTELDSMRQQLRNIEKRAKTNSDRQLNRCLDLAIRQKEVIDRVAGAIDFCSKNHR